jgi:hypothetical protein
MVKVIAFSLGLRHHATDSALIICIALEHVHFASDGEGIAIKFDT